MTLRVNLPPLILWRVAWLEPTRHRWNEYDADEPLVSPSWFSHYTTWAPEYRDCENEAQAEEHAQMLLAQGRLPLTYPVRIWTGSDVPNGEVTARNRPGLLPGDVTKSLAIRERPGALEGTRR